MVARSKRRHLLFIIPAVIALSAVVYFKLYHIDRSRMDIAIGQCASESPDGCYRVTVTLYPIGDFRYMDSQEEMEAYLEENHSEAYVIADLMRDPTVLEDGAVVWPAESRKTIFYGRYDGLPSTIAWLDNETVIINGRTLKLPQEVYDYRRTFELPFLK